jgi:hypothetical protein
MKYAFTIHEDMWVGDGPVFGSGSVVGYRVGGMPDGSTARIHNFGAPNRNQWRVMRIKADNTSTDWVGDYETAEDALVDLQSVFQ